MAYLRYHPEDSLAALSLADSLQSLGAVDRAADIRTSIIKHQTDVEHTETGDRLTQLQHILFALSLDKMSTPVNKNAVKSSILRQFCCPQCCPHLQSDCNRLRRITLDTKKPQSLGD